MAASKALIVPALKRHTATVIVAHGLGDSGAGWMFLADDWRRQNKFEEVQFIFPNAPAIPITLNMGMRMPGWFDILSLGPSGREDDSGMLRTQEYLQSLIAEQVSKGIPSERVVLGGFSQGGAMSLITGLTNPTKLGGIFALSCWLPLSSKAKEMIAAKGDVNRATKIFMAHGDADPVVQYDWGKKSGDRLKEWGYNVDFHTYRNLAHSAHPKEIEALEKYLCEVVPPLGEAAQGQGNL